MSGTKKSTTAKVGKVEGNSSTAKAEAEQKALDNFDADLNDEAKARAELEAEAKAGAEAKAKLEAEAKAGAEAKAKLEAEAKAEAEAEAKAKLEAEAKAEAEAEAKAKLEADKSKGDQIVQVDSKKGDVVHPGDGVDAIGVLGAFKVCAKSDAGFWRSGVQFHRLQEKLVLVVEQEPDASARVHEKDHEPECVVFLSPEKAKRVHDEPHLTVEVVELEDVLDLQFMQQ